MRAFLGIEPYIEVKASINELQRLLRTYAINGRWTNPYNFHITLKFFEDLQESVQIKAMHEVLNICKHTERFNLKMRGLDCFKGKDEIRVLWLGFEDEAKQLLNLQREIEEAMEKYGFIAEKREFKPHITIGQKLHFQISMDELASLAEKIEFPRFQVDQVTLFKSEQIKGTRVYTSIEAFKLT